MGFNIFQGDPRIFIDEDGAYLDFKGGQPVMDQGLENLAIISLFTNRDWCGNDLFDDVNERLGSDFESTARAPITLTTINNVRDAAEKALDNDAFGDVQINVENPSGLTTLVEIIITPPGEEAQRLIVSKNGLNWVAQKFFPAYERGGNGV